MKRIRNKGMLSLEYAILLAILVAALLGTALYMKRAICGRWRSAADVFGYGRQYQPE
jgi:uncharacterized protein (UPF0333 family)